MGDPISALAGLFGSYFDDPGKASRESQNKYEEWYNKGKDIQNPFYNAGTNAIPKYQEWLEGMKNPTDFINKMMGDYQESPWAKYQQEQAVRRGQNAGSASGLTGSTPLTQFMQQNARDISSQDMNQWLQNVLGVNSQYGSGLFGEMGVGQNSANTLTNLTGDYGKSIAEQEYKRRVAEQNRNNNIWGGIVSLGSSFL